MTELYGGGRKNTSPCKEGYETIGQGRVGEGWVGPVIKKGRGGDGGSQQFRGGKWT